tara:strand:+ start:335 stop:478 length:144 start_codon:yes stop_codon:yes gene_type:complete
MGKQAYNNKTITVITGGSPGAPLISVPLTSVRTERRKLERKLKKNNN